MNSEVPTLKRRDPGRTVIRVIAVMMLAWALWSAGHFVTDLARGTGGALDPSSPHYVFALWRIGAVVLWLLLTFGSIQLFRLRRSGWIASVACFAGGTAWLTYMIVTNWLSSQAHAWLGALYPNQIMQSVVFSQTLPQIERVTRSLRFLLACEFVPLVYLVSEWHRFIKRETFRPSRALTYTKLSIACLFLTAAGVWNFWAGPYYATRRVLDKLKGPASSVTQDEFNRLSERGKAQACALLIRRLARERTDSVAALTGQLWCWQHLQFLTAEDIPAIIAASKGATPRVSTTCYGILELVQTPEAERCLMERLDGPRDEAWQAALSALRRFRPQKAPDVLIELVSKAGPERKNLISDLAQFRDPRALEILLAVARDPDVEIRREVLMRLDRFPGQAAEQVLQTALEDPDPECRGWAFGGLMQIGTASSVPRLIQQLRLPDMVLTPPYSSGTERVHEDAAGALSAITGQDFGEDAAKWEQWWQENAKTFDMQRECVDRLLAPLPAPPRRLPRTPQEFAADPYYEAASRQHAAVRHIRQRNLRQVAPKLVEFLKPPGPITIARFEAARTLLEWGYREGIDWQVAEMEEPRLTYTGSFPYDTVARATGVNFFSDTKRWREWWQANREKFPSALDGEEKATTHLRSEGRSYGGQADGHR